MVETVPVVTNWSVTPQNGQVGYFTLMNTWLFESTSVIASLNTAINKINEAGQDINDIGANAINAITFDSIAQLKLNSNIGRVDVLGYYEKGDGGGGTFYWDLTSTETDNGGTIIQATGITTGRWKRHKKGMVSVKEFGAKGDGVADDTLAIQKAINSSNRIYISAGTYCVSQITINPYKIIIGESNKVSILASNTESSFILIYESPILTSQYDTDASLQITDIHFVGKNHIKINRAGDYSTVFSKQQLIKNINITRCIFEGDFSLVSDANNGTNIAASYNHVASYGTAIELHGVFDSCINSNIFLRCGIGIYLDGCDINKIDINRFDTCSRAVHIYGHDTFGHQNKVINNDILNIQRVGHITTNAPFTTIMDNYFETYLASAKYIDVTGGFSQYICANRFDSSGYSTPILSLAPSYGCVVTGNRYNPSTVSSNLEVLSTNYSSTTTGLESNFLVSFRDNSSSFTETKYPYCQYDDWSPYVFNYKNPQIIGGVKATTFPFSIGAITNEYCITGGGDTLLTSVKVPDSRNINITITGASLSTGSYVIISCEGVTLFADQFGLLNTKSRVSKTFRLPSVVNSNSIILFEIVTSQIELVSIDVKPSDIVHLSAPPTDGYWFAKERVLNLNPSIGQPKSWICTASGTPGTWVSEGNL